MLELAVKLKSQDGERSYQHKHVIYHDLCINDGDNACLRPYIEDAKKIFAEEEIDEVNIVIKMTV